MESLPLANKNAWIQHNKDFTAAPPPKTNAWLKHSIQTVGTKPTSSKADDKSTSALNTTSSHRKEIDTPMWTIQYHNCYSLRASPLASTALQPLNYITGVTPVHSMFGTQPSRLSFPDTAPVGGSILPKNTNHVRMSSINPNRIRFNSIDTTLQLSLDLDIDIRCYSEINLDKQQRVICQKIKKSVQQADCNSKSTWSSSQVPAVKHFKPGGTVIDPYDKLSSKVKTMGSNSMGRWCYQIIEGKSDIDLFVVSINQSCRHQGTD